VLKRPALVLGYLGVAFAGGAFALVRQIAG
jgi:hypothetical protein